MCDYKRPCKATSSFATGAALRSWVQQKFLLGQWPAVDVATLCWHLTRCGLQGFGARNPVFVMQLPSLCPASLERTTMISLLRIWRPTPKCIAFRQQRPQRLVLPCGILPMFACPRAGCAFTSPTGSCRNQVARALDLPKLEEALYRIEVPMCKNGQRVFLELPVRLPHEAILVNFKRAPGAWRSASESALGAVTDDVLRMRDRALKAAHGTHVCTGLKDVPSFRDHSVVRQHGLAGVVPFGVFIDGAWGGLWNSSRCLPVCDVTGPQKPDRVLWTRPYGKARSFTSYTLNNPILRQRLVIAIVRKDDECGVSCGCACRGRCTHKAIEKLIAWCGT